MVSNFQLKRMKKRTNLQVLIHLHKQFIVFYIQLWMVLLVAIYLAVSFFMWKFTNADVKDMIQSEIE